MAGRGFLGDTAYTNHVIKSAETPACLPNKKCDGLAGSRFHFSTIK